MSKLLALPQELPMHTRSFIPVSDELTHVSLQSTCKLFRDLYMEDEKFWISLCAACNIGRPLVSTIPGWKHPMQDATWRELGIVMANHYVSCAPCKVYHPLGFGDGISALPLSPIEVQKTTEVVHGTTVYIRFSLMPLPLIGDDVVLDCHTRHGKEESTFLKHAPNTCVFATYPQSLETLSIIVLGSIQVDVTNKTGVTRWDVVAHVDQTLDHALTFAELFEIYQTYRDADTASIQYHLTPFDFLRDTTVGQFIPMVRQFFIDPAEDKQEIADKILAICDVIPIQWYSGGLWDFIMETESWSHVTILNVLRTLYDFNAEAKEFGWMYAWRSYSTLRGLLCQGRKTYVYLALCSGGGFWFLFVRPFWGIKQVAPGSVTFKAEWLMHV